MEYFPAFGGIHGETTNRALALSFVSIGLAETILLILLFPLYAAIHINTSFYDAGYLFFRAITSNQRSIQ
jgi:predicted ABC-type exoprotein transport system permease subunit